MLTERFNEIEKNWYFHEALIHDQGGLKMLHKATSQNIILQTIKILLIQSSPENYKKASLCSLYNSLNWTTDSVLIIMQDDPGAGKIRQNGQADKYNAKTKITFRHG